MDTCLRRYRRLGGLLPHLHPIRPSQKSIKVSTLRRRLPKSLPGTCVYEVLSCVRDEHGSGHVIAAVLICAFSAIATMFVFHRGQVSQSMRVTRVWAAVAGVVTGLGIWATHFVAMLGYQPGFEVQYDGLITAVSALIAVLGFMTTSQILITSMSPLRRVASALIATVAVAVMHYYGMTALNVSALIEHDETYVTASIVVSGLFFAMTYSIGLSDTRKWRNFIGLGATLAAVASLHFIGATGLNVIPLQGLVEARFAISANTLEVWVALVLGLILICAVMAAGFDSFVERFAAANRRKISILANSALEGLFIVSRTGEVVEVNKAAQSLLGLPRAEILGREITALLPLGKAFDPKTEGTKDWGERELTRADGTSLWADISLHVHQDREQRFSVFVVRDLTERRAHEAEIRTLAFQDKLTGLANRAAFKRAVDEHLDAGEPPFIGMLLVNLKDFKSTNDQHGHEIGDVLLQQVAARIAGSLPEASTLARFAGDEYAILLPDLASAKPVTATAKTLFQAVRVPVSCDGRDIPVEISIGAVCMRKGRTDFQSLLKAAERALSAAKRQERTRFRLYDAELHSQQELGKALEADLAHAVARDEFVLHYQPKVDAKSRKVVGYEALIRWNRPGHGLVYPDAFIPIAEKSDMINAIGAWTIRRACRDAMTWAKDVHVSVNLSGRQFLDVDLGANVLQALSESGLPGERLELEITETALVQNAEIAARVLKQLKTLGISIALDDFGTGYSSMSYVQSFEFDRIKIDKSFVDELGQDKKATSIVETIVYLGRALSVPIVAEGVETEAQAQFLTAINCRELQGYLIARPMPFEETERTETAA